MRITGTAPTQIKPYPLDWPQYFGAPIHYRFDGNEATLNVGDRESISLEEPFKIKLIDFRWIKEERWGRGAQYWLDLAFVANDSRVGVLALKKDSASNVFGALEEAMRETGYSCYCFSLDLIAESRDVETEDGEDYFFTLDVHEISYTPEHEIEAIAQFVGSEQFEWIFPGETR